MTDREEQRKTRIGRVVSMKMDKTVVVAVERRVHHRLYHKSMRRVRKFVAHDEHNEYQIGDTVRLIETRPLSKTKRWRVSGLVKRYDVPDVQPSELAEPVLNVNTEPLPSVTEVEAPAEEEAPEAVAEVEAPAEEEAPEAVAEVEAPAEEETPEAVAEVEAPAEEETPEAVAEVEAPAEEEEEKL
mgnify:CR=1 FL=1